MAITSFLPVLPAQPDSCYPGSKAFARIANSNLHEVSPFGRRQQEMESLSVPVKQIRSGGYIKPMYAPPERSAKMRIQAQHVHPPNKTPVNGTILRVVGTAENEDNGRTYPPESAASKQGKLPATGGGGFNQPRPATEDLLKI